MSMNTEVRQTCSQPARPQGRADVVARDHALLLFATTTGLRVSELLELRIGDVVEELPALVVRLL